MLWVVPFVVQFVGEYVVEIVEIIRRELVTDTIPATVHHAIYGRFAAENPAFVALTAQRVASYWDCYFRNRYPSIQEHPGTVMVDALRPAGSAVKTAETVL